MTDRLSQKALAERLGVTDRRVRQLVAKRLLPEPDDKGQYDWATAEQRYRLYARGTDSEWTAFIDEIEQRGRKADKLVATAVSEAATVEDIGTAGREVLWVFGSIRFAHAVKIKSEAERALLDRLVDYDERAAFAPIFAAFGRHNNSNFTGAAT